MTLLNTFYVATLFISALSSIGLAIYAWSQRQTSGVYFFFWWVLMAGLWAGSSAMSAISPTEYMALIFTDKVRLLAIPLVPVFLFLFALEYTGLHRWLKRHWLILFLVIPICTQVIAIVGSPLFIDGSVFKQVGSFLMPVTTTHGSWFWVHTGYSYIMVLGAMGVVFWQIFQVVSPYREQAILILVGISIPFVVNIFSLFFSNLPSWDFTALSFPFVFIIWTWALFRYQLLDITPVARNAILESMMDAVFVLDQQDRIIDMNPAAQLLAGASFSQIAGKQLSDVFPNQKDLLAQYREVTQTQAEIAIGTDRGERVFDLSISPLHHRPTHQRPGQLAGRLIVLRDITERIQLIQELDAYAHTVAHDLKSPLTAMIGYLALLEGMTPEQLLEKGGAFVERATYASHKMNTIINELLLMARIRKLEEIEVSELDMGQIVGEVQERLGVLMEKKGAIVKLPASWTTAYGYAPWVEEVWSNYISNALKYGGEPPVIEVGAEVGARNMVRFWVQDNGEGLTEAQQAIVFDKFSRFKQVKAEGHGLGLSIVQRIVTKLGGQVGVQGVVGQGSTFWFTLPLHKPHIVESTP